MTHRSLDDFLLDHIDPKEVEGLSRKEAIRRARQSLHERVVANTQSRFLEAAKRYQASPEDFRASWFFLLNHPAFRSDGWSSMFTSELYPFLYDDGWGLEIGPWYEPDEVDEESRKHWPQHGVGTHDYELDAGGETFEEAIVELAANVYRKYGLEKPPWS